MNDREDAEPPLSRLNRNLMENRHNVERNIEKHRKGDANIKVVGQDGQVVREVSVEVRQQTHEVLFGYNALVLGQLDTREKNRKYEDAFVRLFNLATVPFYWEGTEPRQGARVSD